MRLAVGSGAIACVVTLVLLFKFSSTVELLPRGVLEEEPRSSTSVTEPQPPRKAPTRSPTKRTFSSASSRTDELLDALAALIHEDATDQRQQFRAILPLLQEIAGQGGRASVDDMIRFVEELPAEKGWLLSHTINHAGLALRPAIKGDVELTTYCAVHFTSHDNPSVQKAMLMALLGQNGYSGDRSVRPDQQAGTDYNLIEDFEYDMLEVALSTDSQHLVLAIAANVARARNYEVEQTIMSMLVASGEADDVRLGAEMVAATAGWESYLMRTAMTSSPPAPAPDLSDHTTDQLQMLLDLADDPYISEGTASALVVGIARVGSRSQLLEVAGKLEEKSLLSTSFRKWLTEYVAYH